MVKRYLTLMLSALVLLAVACSHGGEPPAVKKQVETDTQELTLNLGVDPPSLDHSKVSDIVSFTILNAVLEGLMRLGENGQPEKGLAESWKRSDDGKTYIFTLRDTVWSDGKPVTSADFAYSWMRALDPRTASDYAYLLHYIEGAEALNALDFNAPDFVVQYEKLRKEVGIRTPDDKTLEVRLMTPTPFFLALTAFPTLLPAREDVVTRHGPKFATGAEEMLFNGPFLVASWERESEIILKKNPRYWDAGAVRLEQVTWKMIRDPMTAMNMYEVDELDMVGISAEFTPRFRDQELKSMALASTFYLVINVDGVRRPELGNKKLRQALSLALDRKSFADSVLRNGSVPALGFVPPSLPGVSDSYRNETGPLIDVTGNRSRARQLFKEASQEMGKANLTLTLLISDGQTSTKVAEKLGALWQEALPGLEIKVEPVQYQVRLQRARRGDFEITTSEWIGDYNDPMTFMDMFVTGGPYNDAKWSNPRFDDLIRIAKEQSDPQVRMEAMAEAEKVLLEELPILPVWHSASNWAEKPWLKGLGHLPVGGDIELKRAYVEGKGR